MSEKIEIALFRANSSWKSILINDIVLTERQIDIIACVLHGRSVKRIAAILSISPKTVEAHIRNINLKLGCRSQDNICRKDKII